MNIILLYGGKSGENEISALSASSVLRHINTKEAVTLIGIAKNGEWFIQDKSEVERVRADASAVLSIAEHTPAAVVPGHGILNIAAKSLVHTDVVFPALHGTFGEDGAVQGLLEIAELPYVGSGITSSALGMDKEHAMQIWRAEGLPVVPWVCLKQPFAEDALDACEASFAYPLFVKPCSAGSSVGTAIVQNRAQLKSAVENAFLWDEKILVEPAIPAREIECSVTGNSVRLKAQDIRAYTPGEILPSHEFYDYDAKYTDPNGALTKIPAAITAEQSAFITDTAKKAYTALDCAGLARVDFFIHKTTNEIFLNEINTMPGFTSISMFPKMCEASGLSYDALIELLLEEGITRFRESRTRRTNYDA
jgi:D-alanine-D-alanine ligase